MISPQIKNYVLEGIYNGYISTKKLPENLYLAIVKNLMSSVNAGFKTKPVRNDLTKKFVGDQQIKQSFQDNIYRFSAAKTFQEVYEIQQKVFDDEGFKIGFSEFKEQAETIWNDFNEDWLKTEMNTAFGQAQAAEQWQEFEAQKEILPYLTFKTVGDDRVREDHQALDGICLPVDDPFWDENTTPLEWNCRCIIISGSEDNTTPESEVKDKLSKIDINEDFRFNPGKEHIAFKDTHPYFDVPEKYQEFKDNNFNLPLPEIKAKENIEVNEFEELKKRTSLKADYIDSQLEHTSTKSKEYEKLADELIQIDKYQKRLEKLDVLNNAENFEKTQKTLNFKGTVQELFGDGKLIASKIAEKETGFTISALVEDGYLQRTFDLSKKVVSMDEFYLSPLLEKGKGKGTDMFYKQVNEFKKLGYKKLITTAGNAKGMNGYYTWARLGYDIKVKEEADIFRMVVKPSEDKEIKGVKSLQELMSTKKGRNYWKENGFAFTGTFDLSDDSKSMNILERYIKTRK